MTNIWDENLTPEEIQKNMEAMLETAMERELWEEELELLDPDVREELYERLGL